MANTRVSSLESQGAGQGAEFQAQIDELTEELEADGYEPWFDSFFSPAGETESGLFALQAALGAGVLGYVLGALIYGTLTWEGTAGVLLIASGVTLVAPT